MITLTATASRTAAELVRHLQPTPANPIGAYAVRLQLRHPPGDHDWPWLRALFRHPLEPLEAAGKARAYALADTDHVVVCDDLSLSLVDRAIARLNQVIPHPDDEGDGADAAVVASWFDLSRADDRDAVARVAADAALADAARADDAPLRPITAADLPTLAELLTADRLAPLLRRQRALVIRSAADIRPLYTEVAVSIGALQRGLAPGIDLRARSSLFRCLGDRLDKTMLAAISVDPQPALPAEPFCVALRLATLATCEFAAFAAALAASAGETPRRTLIQIPLNDVLADFDAFAAARNRLDQDGFRVVLGGLSPMTLDIIDPAGFGADFVKVRFPEGNRDCNDESPVERLSGAVRRIGSDRLIFADIDNEATVIQALAFGVRRFQGRFVDELITAMVAKGLL